MKLVITNGCLLEFLSDQRGDINWRPFKSIVVQDGLIHSIDDDNQAELQKDAIFIDAQDQLVIPGLTDLCVSLPEPGYATKGTIETETQAAVAGGVTTAVCIPESDPINDSPAVTKLILEKAAAANACKVLPLGALTQGLKGESLAEYASLKAAGCIALSNVYHPLKNLSVTKRCFQYAKTHNLSVFINPIEPSLHSGVMHAGEVSTTIGLPGISSLAETIAVSQLIKLAESTGVHLHLSQLSAADSVHQLKDAKRNGIQVSADVAIQNLLFTDEKVENFNSLYRCLPPLRSESDRQTLIEGVISGTIDAITSTHRPHEAAAKQAPFAETEPGMSNIEFLLPMAQMLADTTELNLEIFIDAMTRGSRKVLNLSSPIIKVGEIADLSILAPHSSTVIKSDTMLSAGKNTPFINQKLNASIQSTIVDGKLVYSTSKLKR